MNDNPKDMALEALLAAAHEAAPDLPPDLLKAVYQIEKTYQFDQDREAPSKSMQKLIDEEINAKSWGGQ
ncbi:MAG: DNA modification system-associated small protein [Sulfuricella sp.]